ncbi:hypothetical protein AB1Y20_014250 [Prymnesium parvum]|uniref:Uncharacterized protein n=1 Tax=Prymnesium parvum TaxID=97485 RepID=A0AB34IFL8_PRYPA|mmetsp:Transcript_39107/g.95023  ORF Transcript_39107/g.95023 Transcript_39107/m.95023 type:complete len:813 (+) Transcript_39107:83-2521(+)|eukprot:CAMPEP_0182824972 /NCGR_PEP_ID=MMETSP0006_2-20121128/15581_1 /TAXON_ID=97485 /ORGANISM="Prymnesium parvum, Strain Texoma1" /LENGTH=812 /DNA_ID=CAMNT_0024952017 /DNA_START=12 /DNA_END=2450 /DNA_ORIENTATION=-
MPLQYLDDSPKFRKELTSVEENIKSLQTFVDRCTKATSKYCHTGHKFNDTLQALANEVLAFGSHDKDPVMSAGVGPALWKVSTTLKEVHELSQTRLVAIEQQGLNRIQESTEVASARIKEARRRFTTCDEEWGKALKQAHSMRKEAQQLQSADRDFIDAKLDFESSRFELVAALNEGEAGKQIELLESIRKSMSAEMEFFEQACGRMRELVNYLDEMQPFITEQRTLFAEEQQRNNATLEHLHRLRTANLAGETTTVPRRNAPDSSMDNAALLKKEGYLYKKSSKVAPKIHGGSWKRLWFRLEGGVLYYQKSKGKVKGDKSEKEESGGSGMRAINLLICTVSVRERDTGRRFCFDLVSPYRSYTLQAESEDSLSEWVDCLRASIEANFYSLSAPSDTPCNGDTVEDTYSRASSGGVSIDPSLTGLAQQPENSMCADCNDASSQPTWAVLPYGSIVCIECSGIHRSLGTHISKVRSTTLDTWTPEMAAVMLALGNRAANEVLEAAATDSPAKPLSRSSSRAEKEVYIRAKYEERRFLAPASLLPRGELPAALCAAARAGDARALLALLVQSQQLSERDESGMSPLHEAAAADQPVSCEMLLLAGASLELAGAGGRTAMHVAAAAGAERCLSILLRRGGSATATDASGATPRELAERGAHEACVRLLNESNDFGERQLPRHTRTMTWSAGSTASHATPLTPPVVKPLALAGLSHSAVELGDSADSSCLRRTCSARVRGSHDEQRQAEQSDGPAIYIDSHASPGGNKTRMHVRVGKLQRGISHMLRPNSTARIAGSTSPRETQSTKEDTATSPRE